MSWVYASSVLLVAFAVDAALGEPPARLHPVVWIGSSVRALLRLAPREGRAAQLVFGALLALLLPSAFAYAAYAAGRAVSSWPWLHFLLSVFWLKASFAHRALMRAGEGMRSALATDLALARRELRNLCSRDASALEPPALIAATVESLAENTSDSVIAPLFYYALLGVPGAIGYRVVNTLDAMVGYRGRYEYLGKASARLDDLLNLVPARLTVVLLLLASAVCGERPGAGLRVLFRDGHKTESPNAGRPMAAMAGLLGVALDKAGHYSLGDAREPLTQATIDRAVRVIRVAGYASVLTFAVGLGVLHGAR